MKYQLRKNNYTTTPEQIEQIRRLSEEGISSDAGSVIAGVSRDTYRFHSVEPRVKKPLKAAEIRDYLEGWSI